MHPLLDGEVRGLKRYLKSLKWKILLKCGVESICEQIKLSKWQVFVTVEAIFCIP